MVDLHNKLLQFILILGAILAITFTAEKCGELRGENSSRGEKFTIFHCFDMGTGTMGCMVREGVKLYFYNIRAAHVEKSRNLAIERALLDALGQGLSAKDAANVAQKEGEKAAKLTTQKAKRVVGPIISSGWDFFESVYHGGTLMEGFLRGSGTLVGAYCGGYFGELGLGRFGYLVGSHIGSWVGGNTGLMVHDIANGVLFLLQFDQNQEGKIDFFDTNKAHLYGSHGGEDTTDAGHEDSNFDDSLESFDHYELR